jgi:hypothetical protein
MTDKGAGVGTTAAGQGRINLQTLWTHVQQNPGTSALRGLRDEFVQDGIPLDKLTPTPGLGSHDAWVNASDPEQKLREYMKWVVSTNQYSSSTAPLFLAQATITWLKSAAAPNGTLDRQRVGQLERKLAERSQRRDPARRIAEHLGTGGVESPHIPALDAVKQQHEAAQTFEDSKVLVPQHLSLPGLDPASSETSATVPKFVGGCGQAAALILRRRAGPRRVPHRPAQAPEARARGHRAEPYAARAPRRARTHRHSRVLRA